MLTDPHIAVVMSNVPAWLSPAFAKPPAGPSQPRGTIRLGLFSVSPTGKPSASAAAMTIGLNVLPGWNAAAVGSTIWVWFSPLPYGLDCASARIAPVPGSTTAMAAATGFAGLNAMSTARCAACWSRGSRLV